jgi:hypothetical protein
MLKEAAAAVAGLGLIGGVGSVVYDNGGDATVKIRNEKTGVVQSVTIGGDGQRFSCPAGTREKLEAHTIQAGRIKITQQQVRRQLRKLEAKYPDNVAPGPVVDRYNALVRRDERLLDAYNAEVDAHNAILDRDCTPADAP